MNFHLLVLAALFLQAASQRRRYQVGYDCWDEENRGVMYKCEECWLTEVPRTIRNTTECIVLSQNSIRTFKEDDFKGLVNLRKLWLHGNLGFNQSSLYTNRHLGNLEALHLTGNTLIKSPANLSLSKLKFLDISTNSIRDLTSMNFTGLPNMTEYDISGNQISDLAQTLQKIPQNLKKLHLNDAYLSMADGAFTRFKSLEHLTIDGNQFTGVPSNLPQSLKVISVEDNPIAKTLRGSFSNLPNLQSVSLHCKSLGADTFLGAPNVTSLNLKTCGIDSFAFLGAENLPKLEMYTPCSRPTPMTLGPSAFAGLNKIQKILLVGTTLSSVPSYAFANLPALTEVWLFSNAIQTVASNAFSGSPIKNIVAYGNELRQVPPNLPLSLESLGIMSNPIDNITTSSFGSLTNLTYLSIKSKAVYADAFKNLPNIKDFTLDTCELHSYALRGLNLTTIRFDRACYGDTGIILHPYSFSGLEFIEQIRITSTATRELPSNAFANLPTLKWLFLHDNAIKIVSDNILSGSNNVEWIRLYSNQLTAIPGNLPTSLQKLEICCNRIDQLRAFPPLPNLQTLSISANEIRSDALLNTPNVTQFEVRTCIKKVGSYAFRGLNKLETLDLTEKCRFGSDSMMLSEYAFSGMKMVKNINVQQNRISRIPRDAFNGLNQLETVDLSQNYISETDQYAFVGTSLKKLFLDRNRLQAVPQGLPTTLGELNLGSNDIVFLDSNSFPLLANLENLTISSQQLRINAFRNCHSVTKLEVRTCDIEGRALEDLKKLENLNVGRCSGWNSQLRLQDEAFVGLDKLKSFTSNYGGIPVIPASCFENLSELKYISLSTNNIGMVDPTAFSGCSKLETLSFSNNQLTEVPSNLPSSLKDLSLDWNNIGHINSYSFGSMPNLTKLSIDVENIETDAFTGVTGLTELNLMTCDIQPYGMRGLTEVKELDIGSVCSGRHVRCYDYSFSGMDNLKNLTVISMENLEPKVFSGLSNLKGLMIPRAQIQNIPTGLLKGLNKLEWFRMNAVNAPVPVVLQKGVFNSGLTKLSNIMLEQAEISSIEEGAFSNLPALQRLHLGSNKLTTMNQTVFENSTAISSVSFNHNMWHCDCNLRWLKETFDSGTIDFDTPRYMTCNSPSSVENQEFGNLQPEDFVC